MLSSMITKTPTMGFVFIKGEMPFRIPWFRGRIKHYHLNLTLKPIEAAAEGEPKKKPRLEPELQERVAAKGYCGWNKEKEPGLQEGRD
ncbi:hypothetical protein E3N88_31514 [Mikania micrantha]|uniref:Uncharacterized protein n=1 Tax=Mikania micrantha TaxID=192012 RepID=A0A5N6MPT8_9ASTR|nr:hypothetical protein E3N88_44200 [Mikania micrantha]KAD3642290.1 hypothetical protein E3N88_31514 [Mikania micrantha]